MSRGAWGAFVLVALTACSGRMLPFGSASQGMPPPVTSASQVRAICPASPARRFRCFALLRTDLVRPLAAPYAVPAVGYTARDLQSAYALPSTTRGGGQIVAVVDAFGYRNAAADLARYRAAMGLPPCTLASGCLRIVNQYGKAAPLPPQPPLNDDWRPEQALDMEMVSAICPKCRIVVVQATSDTGYTGGVPDLYLAENAAVALHADAISNSWGGGELYNGGVVGERSDARFDHPGVAITASAGDNGYFECAPNPGFNCRADGGPEQPCTFATVVCVGGTQLVRAANARGWSEVVWNTMNLNGCGNGAQNCGATESGCSLIVPKPAWQTDRGCTMRSESDVSAVASVSTPVAVYTSAQGIGWGGFGGTSVSAPIVAAVFALAANARAIGSAPQWIWRHGGRPSLNDVTIGNNVAGEPRGSPKCAPSWRYICYARKGYDGPTGWGTPNGIGAF
jgi:subtilase family serine protease